MSACKTFSHQQVHQLLDEVLGPGLHAKRIASLADATLGVMHMASLAVCTNWPWPGDGSRPECPARGQTG